jgi:HSP20 family protein
MVRRSALYPFSLLEELVRGTLAYGVRQASPPVEILAGDTGLTVRTFLPGIDPPSVDVTLEERVLRIRARAVDPAPKDARPLSREIGHGDVDLTLRLGFRPDRAALQATYEAGVLTLELPFSGEDPSQKINVETR